MVRMVRTGNVGFSCKRLTSIEIRKSNYHIIRRVRFRWGSPLANLLSHSHTMTPFDAPGTQAF